MAVCSLIQRILRVIFASGQGNWSFFLIFGLAWAFLAKLARILSCGPAFEGFARFFTITYL